MSHSDTGSLFAGKEIQQTTIHTLLADRWLCHGSVNQMDIPQRQHYRLVTNIPGYPLGTSRGVEELLYATYDAFTGTSFGYCMPQAMRSVV